MRFRDATVVITGVGHEGQVGEAIAKAFAAEGASLALVDRTADAVEARAAAIRAGGARATAYACDLTDPAQVAEVARRVGAATTGTAGAGPQGGTSGRVDALVNVAGGFAMSGPMGQGDLATLRRQIEVNLTTAWVASNAFVPLIRDGGAVVYFASAVALPGARNANMSAYVAAKSAVIGVMHSVADEGRARGVRANAVAPITIRTADNVRAIGANAHYVERDAVADAVLFLCSDAARSITDQVFRLGD
jgi:NAD(P)-dependent dehydrogenase (short-subunit alcohol dehydrogenase family)